MTSIPVFDARFGSWYWFTKDSLHIGGDGRLTGVLHREDGPAVEWADGSRIWWIRGQCHRDDGPAVEWVSGAREWWVCDERHREDGPAVEWADGTREWWVRGQRFENEEAWRKVRRAKKTAR